MNVALLLHNIRSAHNVGSIFRSADAAGVSRIYLSGYTPTPDDRFGRVQKDIAKTALGAQKTVPWGYEKHPYGIIRKLREKKWHITALEQSVRSTDYRKFKSKKPVLLILGNEVRGVSAALLKQCDTIIEIPMRGKKESLNVSVAAGVALFRLLQ